MSDWDAWVGRTSEQQDILTPAALHRFRATIDSAETGDIAPQAIHWCLCLPDAPTAALADDGHPRRDDDPAGFMPPVNLPRRMWAASKVDFLAPISAGAAIQRQSAIAAITEKSGSSGRLVFVDIAHETFAEGVAAVRERQSIVYRDAPTQAAPSAAPATGPGPDLSNWDWHRSVMPSETSLFRYSALTFNSHRIHYDAPYATGAEGYRGLVVHGPLTATLLLDLAARELGANRLRQFSMRAMAPTFAGEEIHLVGTRDGNAVTLAALGSDGRTIMAAEAAL